jgi:glycosyltransferase involved in cell wall biosynthesis
VKRIPAVRFLFVGGGLWRQRLEERVREEGLADHFQFLGLVPPTRIPELLGATDIIVHASYREGLARVLPQAMIAGKPVVSYDVDGAREVVLSDRTGFLVQPHDVRGLAEALIRLATDRDLRTELGAAGRQLFAPQFRHEYMTKRIRELYCTILEGKSSTDRR